MRNIEFISIEMDEAVFFNARENVMSRKVLAVMAVAAALLGGCAGGGYYGGGSGGGTSSGHSH